MHVLPPRVLQTYGLVNDVVLLEFGHFSIARAVSVMCSVDLPEGVCVDVHTFDVQVGL